MTERFVTYEAWGSCEECGFHGLVEFRHRDDEDYEASDALGVMLDCTCPSCGEVEAVLVVIEEYREMLRSASAAKRS